MKRKLFVLIMGLFASALFIGDFSVLAQDREALKKLMNNNYNNDLNNTEI